MAEEKKEEIKKEVKETKGDSYDYKKNHKRSMREISVDLLKKSTEKREEPKEKVETKEPEKVEEKKEEKKEEPKAPVINVDEITSKAKEEARQVAEETARKAFKDETQRILDQNKSIEEKQKEQDELISVWDKEKRLPTDYKEVVAESLRISEAKFKQLQRQHDENNKKEEETKKQEEDVKRSETEKVQQQRMSEITKKINTDLEDLFESKHFTRPPKEYDANNKAQKEVDELLKFGIKLNEKRKEDKKEPIDSLAKIYFLHYKPLKDAANKKDEQPAGANAPISGARSTPKTDNKEKQYDWAKNHKRSYRQIIADKSSRV